LGRRKKQRDAVDPLCRLAGHRGSSAYQPTYSARWIDRRWHSNQLLTGESETRRTIGCGQIAPESNWRDLRVVRYLRSVIVRYAVASRQLTAIYLGSLGPLLELRCNELPSGRASVSPDAQQSILQQERQMRDMRTVHYVTRAPRRLAVAAAVALLLATATAGAQIGSATLGPSLGVPGTGLVAGRTGIPMGATELGSGGLSPGPFSTMPGIFPVTPSVPNTTMGLGPNSTMMSGTTPSLGTGLSPGVVPPSGFSPASPTYGITNYGVGGLQALPGSPVSGSAGVDR
jgi:hypothetical protein